MIENLVISAIEPQIRRKERYNIYSDGEYVAALSAQTIVKIGLKAGQAIDAQTLNKAVLSDNTQYAFDAAVSLLARKMRTRGELARRLSERGITAEAVTAALAKLESYGYINDLEYAKEYVRCAVAAGRLGRRMVQFRLGQLGLQKEFIDESMQMYTDEHEREAAKKQIRLILSKDFGSDKKRKAFAALARRGFDFEIINSILSEYD